MIHISLPYVLFIVLLTPPPPTPTLFPYTTLFRSQARAELANAMALAQAPRARVRSTDAVRAKVRLLYISGEPDTPRSEEHTSELQSHVNLVCRLLLAKKKSSPTYYVRVPLLAGTD